MIYDFKCKKCNEHKNVEAKMSEIKNLKIYCEHCGSEMTRIFTSNLIVPEHMRADNVSEMATLNSSMQTLPSGKRKAIY